MNNNNQIAAREAFMSPVALQQIEYFANKLKDSQALPNTITNGAQLMMVLLAGFEAGMSPMESINSYYIVNGKLTMWGDAVIRQLRRNTYTVKWIETTDKKAVVEIHKDGKLIGDGSFTIEQAATAGLAGKDVWKKYPEDQLRWKAISRAIRFHCPEVLGGVYITEDIKEDITNDKVQATDISIINDEQRDELLQLTEKSGGTEEKIRELVESKFGCKLEDLTVHNWKILTKTLTKKIEDQKAPKKAEESTPNVIEADLEEKPAENTPLESPASTTQPENDTNTQSEPKIAQEVANQDNPATVDVPAEPNPWDDAEDNQTTP